MDNLSLMDETVKGPSCVEEGTMRDSGLAARRNNGREQCFCNLAPARLAWLFGLAFGILAYQADPAVALPPGKAWAPVQQLVVPNYTYLPGPRLETDASGLPVMFVSAYGSSAKDGIGVRWADSTWQVSVQTDLAVGTLQPVVSPLGTFYLVWAGSEPGSAEFLHMAEFRADGLFSVDTVAQVLEYTSLYSGAVAAGGRRWVAVNDNFRPRLLYSDTLRTWREVPLPFADGGCVAVTPLTDTTALVVIAVQGYMRPGVSDGRTWQELGQLTEYGGDISTFRLRPRLPDSQLLVWDSYGGTVSIGSFRGGSWSAPETLTCAYGDPRVGYTFWPNMSHEAGEYPVVTWQAYNGWIGGDVICACLPTDSGFTVADEIWSATFAMHPVAARDRNGDAWVAWWSFQGGTFWTHTYTKAETSAPAITAVGATTALSWVLSEQAPETWWRILRAAGAGPYEIVGRVRAGKKLSMVWSDSTPPHGLVRYRLGRETVDARYRWESDEAAISVGVTPSSLTGRLSVVRASPNPMTIGSTARFVVSNAPRGLLQIRIFDLEGRVTCRQEVMAGGTGSDTIDVLLPSDTGRIAPGLYFMSIGDSSGRAAATTKLAILQ